MLLAAVALQAATVRTVDQLDALTDATTVAAIVSNGTDRITLGCVGKEREIVGYITTSAYLFNRRAGQVSYRFDAQKPADELWTQEEHRAEIGSTIDILAFASRLARAQRLLLRFYETTAGQVDVVFDLDGSGGALRAALGKVTDSCLTGRTKRDMTAAINRGSNK